MKNESKTTKRPTGSNADEWRLFLEEHASHPDFIAVQIAEALDAAERRYISAVKGRGEFRSAYRKLWEKYVRGTA